MARWRVFGIAAIVVGASAVAVGLIEGLPHRPRDTAVATVSPVMPPAQTDRPSPPSSLPPSKTAPPAAGPIFFTRLRLVMNGQAPEACLSFSRRLATDVAVHFEDYVRVEPAASVSLHPNGNELCIGGLAADGHYNVTIAQGLPSADGPSSIAPETVAVSFSEAPATVAFSGSGTILSRDEVHGLPIQTVNLDAVRVTVSRVGDRILARTALGTGYADNEGGEDPDSGGPSRDIAVPVWSGELSVRNQLNASVVTAFPIARILTPRRPGAYIVSITGIKTTKDPKTAKPVIQTIGSARRWIFDTDLMLTSFSGQDGLHVFVRSLKTAQPVEGATVSLLATNNDILSEVKTTADGQAVFNRGLTAGIDALAPRMLMAYQGDDFTAMALERPSLDLSSQDVAGRDEAQSVDAFLYTDRGIYRPGETIDAVGLIRDATAHALKPTPIALVLKRPDGVEAGRWRLDPNEAGGIFQPMLLPPNAPRGAWTILASLAGDDRPIGTLDVQVQDFVPQRLKLVLKPETPSIDLQAVSPQTTGRVDVNARYLFGAPAAALAVEAHLKFTPDADPFGDPSWSFGLVDDTMQTAPQDLKVLPTDDHGVSTVVVDPAAIAFPTTTRPYKAALNIAVVEPGGRTTDADVELPVRSQPRWIGLRMAAAAATTSTTVNDDVPSSRIDVAAFGPDGKRIAASGLTYRLVEIIHEFSFYLEAGAWKFGTYDRERVVALGQVDVGDSTFGVIATPPLNGGVYRVEVGPSGGKLESSMVFYAGSGLADDTNPGPEKVALGIEGAPVKVGAVAHVHIKPPFAGEVLLTVAGSRVYRTQLLSVPADGATVDITGDADWGPGAYIVASLYRPRLQASGHAPVRAIGAAWLPLDMGFRTLTISVATPPVARPRTTLNLPITVTGGASGEPVYVTVAAVDEGLLQLTRFKSPDPNAYYFGKRRLAVDIRDDYDHLIDGDLGETGEIRQGGDAGGGAGLSVVPTKTVALFSGQVKLDASGHATIPFDMPDFAGGLRIMAVAYGRSGIGHTETMMPLRDSVVAEISLPRFLAPQDSGLMTLLLNNVEAPAGRYHVHVAGSGSLTAPVVDADIDLAAAGQAIRTYPISGGDPGIGQVALTLTGPASLAIKRSWPIEIRSPHFPLTLGTVAMQAPGEVFSLDHATAAPFLASTLKTTVDFSTMRGIDLAGLITALDRYPYGCSEQLVSETMPMLYLENLKLAVSSDAPDTEHMRVQNAVNTLLEREDTDGSFGLWQLGDQQATPYLGAYIVDFLFRAKAQGYAVPDEALDRAYGGISNFDSNTNWRTDVFWLYGVDRRATVIEGQAYAAYDLARAGRADISQIRYLNDTFLGDMEPLARAQLAAALSMMGDRTRAAHAFDLAERDLFYPPPRWLLFGDFYRTPLRDTAALLTLAAEMGDDARIAVLTDSLERQDTRTEVLDTQEQAWLSVAAATLLHKGGDLRIAVNQAPAVATKPPLTLRPDVAALTAGYSMRNDGQAAVFRAVTLYGVPLSAPPALENIAHVTKQVTTMDGAPVDLTQVKQNDRMVVHLSGNIDDAAYHQMILVDMLPSGWEIESVVDNSDDPNGGFSWLGSITATKTMQKRDDRFFAAVDLDGVTWSDRTRAADTPDPSRFNLAYVVRAVTPGKFVLPAAVLQDMYRAPVMARSAVGAVAVAGVQ